MAEFFTKVLYLISAFLSLTLKKKDFNHSKDGMLGIEFFKRPIVIFSPLFTISHSSPQIESIKENGEIKPLNLLKDQAHKIYHFKSNSHKNRL